MGDDAWTIGSAPGGLVLKPNEGTSGHLVFRVTTKPALELAANRIFDPDELEHSHAAWSMFKGMLPYNDFFEHHTPWYYYALRPFFKWFNVDGSLESARHFLLSKTLPP